MAVSWEEGYHYAVAIVKGDIPACGFVLKACKRFLDDIETCEQRGFVFDEENAQGVIDFYSNVNHIKGDLSGTTLNLEPWQVFILINLFGWVWKKTRLRRFKSAYIEVARKNGKSTFVAPIGLYMMRWDGEAGAEVYSAATSRDQARIVFDTARDMVRSGCLKDYLQVYNHSIFYEGDFCCFKPLASESDSLEGKNTHLAIIDELHAHKNRRVYDVLELSLAARSQPIIFTITTAGNDRTGICYEVRNYLTKVLDGVIEDDTCFGMIYTLDNPENWYDESEWIKANPNLGISVNVNDMRQLCHKAMQSPSAASEFKRKRLDIWCEGEAAYYNMTHWHQCPEISEDDYLRTLPCFFGMDLASKLDITAVVALFVDDNRHYHLKGKFFLPESVLDPKKTGKAHHIQKLYHDWAEQGWLILTPGQIVDYRVIYNHVLEWATGYEPCDIAFDPWGATQLASQLQEDHGLSVVSVQQSVKNFSEAMKEMEAVIIDHRLHHEHNPLLAWMFANVTARVDKNDNVFPNKDNDNNKIDGAVAAFLAMNRAIAHEYHGSVYESEDLLIL